MDTMDLLIKNIRYLMSQNEISNPTQLSALMETAKLDYSQPNLSRLLNKKYKTLELENLVKLSRFFGVTIGQLLGTEIMTKSQFMPKHDVFKQQLCDAYDRLNDENKHELARHANLLMIAQGVADKTANPFTTQKEKQ